MLNALFAGDFDRYFAEAAQEAAQEAPLWLFVHVPKTAGSSMHAEISAILRPDANIHIDYTDTSKPYHVLLDEAVTRFIEAHRAAPYRFATGHIVARHIDTIVGAVPALRLFTTLRHPVARLVSDYRYQRSAMNVARDAFISNTPDFDTYIARKHVHNKIATALVPRPIIDAGDTEAGVRHVLDRFAFVGLQEMYPICLRALTTLMGAPRAPEARVRINDEPDNRVDLTPELEAELKRLNSFDMALHQEFTQRWRAIRDPLREWLNRNRPMPAK